jgi:hypothetical protein
MEDYNPILGALDAARERLALECDERFPGQKKEETERPSFSGILVEWRSVGRGWAARLAAAFPPRARATLVLMLQHSRPPQWNSIAEAPMCVPSSGSDTLSSEQCR